MMRWVAAVRDRLPRRSSVRLQRAAKALASETEDFVRHRIGRHVVEMSRSEARGYIRARAALPVGRAVEKKLARDPSLPRRSQASLQALVIEDVVRLVIRDLTEVPAVASVVRRAG